jgi:hypothetical protein
MSEGVINDVLVSTTSNWLRNLNPTKVKIIFLGDNRGSAFHGVEKLLEVSPLDFDDSIQLFAARVPAGLSEELKNIIKLDQGAGIPSQICLMAETVTEEQLSRMF